jgi:transmembrane sensor
MIKENLDRERFIKYFKGKYAEKDSNYVDQVFEDNDYEEELKDFLSEQFDTLSPVNENKRKNLDHILYKIHYDINTKRTKHEGSKIIQISRWALRIAGILMLPVVVMIGIQTYKHFYLQKEAWVEIIAPAWTRIQFSLPDGTKGWLNSNSRLRYDGDFYDHRQVSLSGEAFFDVHKDNMRPFVLNTCNVEVKVLGTRFNIAAYDNEKSVEVVLEEGEIELNEKRTAKCYTMKPNDLIVYDKAQNDFTQEIVQPQKYKSWTEGKLIFRNDPLDVVARRLERWYNIDVEINGNLSQNHRLRATFIDEDLEEILNLLKRSLPIDFRIEHRCLQADDTYSKKKVVITCQ